MATLPINRYLPDRPADPPPPSTFTESTKTAVDEIISRCATELRAEIETLHKMLDDFERTSTTSAAHAKHSLESYVETIHYGHQLTAAIYERLAQLRREQAAAFHDGGGHA